MTLLAMTVLMNKVYKAYEENDPKFKEYQQELVMVLDAMKNKKEKKEKMYLSFKDILMESGVKKTIKREFPEVRFNLEEHDHPDGNFIVLNIVVVKYKERSKGTGTEFMRRLVELADQEQEDIFLSADDSYAEKDGMNKKMLIKWYKKFGFKDKPKSEQRNKNTMVYYH